MKSTQIIFFMLAMFIFGLFLGQQNKLTQKDCDYQCSISLEAQADLCRKAVHEVIVKRCPDIYALLMKEQADPAPKQLEPLVPTPDKEQPKTKI